MVVKPRRLHLCTFIYSFSHIFIYLLLQCSGVELRCSNVYSPPNYPSSPSVCFQPVSCAAASMSQLVFTPMQQLIISPLRLIEPLFLYSSIVAVPPVSFVHFPINCIFHESSLITLLLAPQESHSQNCSMLTVSKFFFQGNPQTQISNHHLLKWYKSQSKNGTKQTKLSLGNQSQTLWTHLCFLLLVHPLCLLNSYQGNATRLGHCYSQNIVLNALGDKERKEMFLSSVMYQLNMLGEFLKLRKYLPIASIVYDTMP